MGKHNSRRRNAMRNSVRHAPLALSLPLFFAAAFPAVRMAACVSWNVAGAWTFIHDDNSIRKLRLEHAKSRITGSTIYRKDGNYRSPNREGLIDGTLVGNRLEMTILWKSGVMSMYEATISPNGSLQGKSYDKRDPGRQIHWLADRQASCTAL